MDAAIGVEALQSLQHLVSDAADLGLRQTMVQLCHIPERKREKGGEGGVNYDHD